VLPLTEAQGKKLNEEQRRQDLNQELQRQDQVKHETEQWPDRHTWRKTQISRHSKTTGSRTKSRVETELGALLSR
jgi:gas vesicle protein